MNRFGETLIRWYQENKRDLPWRDTKDPYKIWISEIILQQTRVAQGYDYYCRFVERFPDVFALADADEDEVMKYWQGLGYYSRARNLHEAARTIAGRGAFPETYEEVRKLKGVGDYTAAAICSFAYGMPYAVVDGNVYRVLSRWMGIEEPIDTASGKKMYAALAQELLEESEPALYNQAIMDFGALQCVPASPSCLFCPLSDGCVALQKGLVGVLPRKQHKTKVTERYFLYFYIEAGGCTFLHKREAGDIWHNLYELPLIETEREIAWEELCGLPAYKRLFDGCKVHAVRLVEKRVKHVLSHQVLLAVCYVIEVESEGYLSKHYLQVDADSLEQYAFPRLIHKLRATLSDSQ